MTLGDMYKNWFDPFEEVIRNQMDVLLQGMSKVKERSMRVLYSKRLRGVDSDYLLPTLILEWMYSYKSKRDGDFRPSFTFVKEDIFDFVKAQMDKFIIYRDPIILPKETVTVQHESSLKPISFVNIGK